MMSTKPARSGRSTGVPAGHLQDAVSEEADPRRPVVVEQDLGHRRRGRVVVLGHDR